MNRLESNRCAVMRLLLAAALCATAASLPAGEPIIVPAKDKPKSAPLVEAPATREVFRLRQQSLPFDVLNVPGIVRPSESDQITEDKRHRLKRLERQNWMIVSQGELQEEDEAKNFLGVRDYSVEDIDKDQERENLMFRRMKKDEKEDEDDRRIPGQARSARDKDKSRHPNLRREQQDDVNLDSVRDGDLRDSPDRARELPIKPAVKAISLFESPASRGESRDIGNESLAPKFNKSDLRLPGLLQPAVDSATMREQEARREEFRNYLNKSAALVTGSVDPINARNDLTRQPMNPTTPQPFAAPAPATGGNPFGPPADVKSSPLSANLPALAPRAPTAFPGGPFAAPQNPTRSWQPPQSVTFEVPKRKF